MNHDMVGFTVWHALPCHVPSNTWCALGLRVAWVADACAAMTSSPVTTIVCSRCVHVWMTADLRSLAKLIPARARMVLGPAAEQPPAAAADPVTLLSHEVRHGSNSIAVSLSGGRTRVAQLLRLLRHTN